MAARPTQRGRQRQPHEPCGLCDPGGTAGLSSASCEKGTESHAHGPPNMGVSWPPTYKHRNTAPASRVSSAPAPQPETGCASRPSAQRLRRFSFAELPFLLRGALLAVTPRIALMASSWWETRPQIITLYLREYASPSVTIDSAIRFVGQRGS